MPNHYAENQIDQNKKQWIESAYKFTQPVRYFKNNDPYHWEIDNIPIKQLEENVLWLKDQMEAGSQVSGITRSDLAELKPVATGSSRTVKVQKGRFTARINDAFGKGIQTLIKTANASVNPLAPSDRKVKFNLPTNVLKQIAGDLVGEALYFNGLYEHLQHHTVNPSVGNLSWTAAAVTSIGNIPKNKLAVWRQAQTMDNDIEGLAEQAVAFTRRWGGAIRTSVVNVKDDIEIQIPAFSESDYANNTGVTPAMRADLLFIYAHPIDAESTTIALPDGQSPTVITEPRLGLLKGAGVVSLKGFGDFDGYDSADVNDANFFDSTLFEANTNNQNAFFRETGAVSEEGHFQVVSPIADLVAQQDTPFTDVSVSFPSPDDVMNLTPLFQEGLENSFALIGQSVLPIAYVITRRGKTVIEDSDIIDIRPFLRTAELSYNERAGVAAANPPLSFANPAVGKTELNKAMVKAVTQLKSYVDGNAAPGDSGAGGGGGGSMFITKGAILGGTKFGVEGALLSLAGANEDSTFAGEDDIIAYLGEKHGLIGLPSVPELPGWDLGGWTDDLQGNPTDIGELRNDRINCAIKLNNDTFQDFTGSEVTQGVADIYYDRIANNRWKAGVAANGNPAPTDHQDGTEIIYYLRKRLKVALPLDVVDYDINANFRNCVPRTVGQEAFAGQGVGYTGISIEKHGIVGNEAEFTIYVAFTPRANTMFMRGNVDNFASLQHDAINPQSNSFTHECFWAPMNSKSTTTQRSRDIFSAFHVFNEYYADNFRNVSTGSNFFVNNSYGFNNINERQPAWSALVPLVVTYPTVEFSVTGYTQLKGQNYIFDTETTGGQPIIT